LSAVSFIFVMLSEYGTPSFAEAGKELARLHVEGIPASNG
jgi:hypothetical protein